MEIIQKILCLKNRGRREGRKGGEKVEREEGVGRGGGGKREREGTKFGKNNNLKN